MDILATFLAGISLLWGLLALGVGSVVAGLVVASRRAAPQPACRPVMLVDSTVCGGVRGILP